MNPIGISGTDAAETPSATAAPAAGEEMGISEPRPSGDSLPNPMTIPDLSTGPGAADALRTIATAAAGTVTARARAETAAQRQRLPAGEEWAKLAERMAARGPVADTSEARQAEGMRRERLAALFRALKPPAHYRDARLGKCADPAGWPEWWAEAAGEHGQAAYADVCRRLAAFIRNYGMIALVGPRGTGKTRLAFAALIEAVADEKSAMYRKAADVFIDIQDTFNRGKGEASTRVVLERLIRPDFLCIDELSEMQADRDWQAGRLTYLLDRRYDEDKSTILIANDEADTFTKKMGASAMSRLGERGRIIVCNWPSFRNRPVVKKR